MTRSWISDTPDEVEHPPIPLGLNKMAVPRAALILSVVTAIGLILSSVWLGLSAMSFLDDVDSSLATTDVELLKENDRWVWEIGLLFDSCSSREDDWVIPDSWADQDDKFLFPGELRCDWRHQGEGDTASLAVYNRGNETLSLVLEISGGGVVFSANENEPFLIINELGRNESVIVEIALTESIEEREVSITATHVSVLQAQVRMDVNIFEEVQKDIHIDYNDRVEVDYVLWDADTDDKLDEGTLWVTAGNDPTTIDGFEWSAIGLDIDSDRGAFHPATQTGTTHTTLLPPPIAYGNSEGHELQDTWLRFELKVNRAPLS